MHLKLPRWLGGKDPPTSAGDVGDVGSISGSGRSSGEGMAIHSSILAWKISWTDDPGRLQSTGLAKSQTQLSTHMYMQKVVCEYMPNK